MDPEPPMSPVLEPDELVVPEDDPRVPCEDDPVELLPRRLCFIALLFFVEEPRALVLCPAERVEPDPADEPELPMLPEPEVVD
jgi:hypothetical protein